jgi:hypothetical protein
MIAVNEHAENCWKWQKMIKDKEKGTMTKFRMVQQ